MTTNDQILNGQNQTENDVEIDVLAIFKMIGKRLWAVILMAVIFGAITYSINLFLIHPTYRSEFTVYVNNRTSNSQTDSLTSGDINASQALVKTYSSIIKSRPVLHDSIQNAGLNYDAMSLIKSKAVTVENVPGTEIMRVYVTLESADDAYRLAKEISKVSSAKITSIVEGSSMKIVDDPQKPLKPYKPNKLKNTVMFAILGALLEMVYIALTVIFDRRVKNEDELQMKYGIPVIGTIPNFDASYKVKQEEYYGG